MRKLALPFFLAACVCYIIECTLLVRSHQSLGGWLGVAYGKGTAVHDFAWAAVIFAVLGVASGIMRVRRKRP